MRNLLIVLLTAVLVVVGAFLPRLLLDNAMEPELELEYQQVAISAETSSDYAWRMERIATYQYGDDPDLLSTYIPVDMNSDDARELQEQLMKQIAVLADQGVLSQTIAAELLTDENLQWDVHCFYLFDQGAINGLRIAMFDVMRTFANGVIDQQFYATMDVESGKICSLHTVGSVWGINANLFGQEASSRYDILRAFADYLGLSSGAITAPAIDKNNPGRNYYESYTVERLAANLPTSGSAWLETRIMIPSPDSAFLCVFQGGK